MTDDPPLHLAVALDGAGWHPAAWRDLGAPPDQLLTAAYWAGLAAEAERGLLDFVTIEDSPGLDAVLAAGWIAPATSHIGLVPAATVSHTEPFRVSKAIAGLDYASLGRAGWRPQLSRPWPDSLFGQRGPAEFQPADFAKPQVRPVIAEHFDEAADFVELVRALWDSSISRRPPQGQPLVTALAHAPVPYRFAARAADVVFVAPRDAGHARAIVAEVRAQQAAAGRAGETLHVFADLLVFLAENEAAAAGHRARLDDAAGEQYAGDAASFAGTPAGLAELLRDWQQAGLTGFRLRPAVLPRDLLHVTRGLVPELQRTHSFRTCYTGTGLRKRLGLARPASRYAAAAAG